MRGADALEYGALVGLVFVFVSMGVLILTSAIFGQGGLDQAIQPEYSFRLLDITVSGVLTLALVVLYRQQKDILEEQVDLKEAELSGELYVNDYSFDGEDINVELSNLSGSEISDLRVFTEIFPQEIGERTLGVRGKRLQRADEHGTQFGRPAGLAPREQSVQFTGTPSVFYVDSEGSEMLPELTFFITELRDEEIDELKCRMWVQGTDQLGDEVKSKILRWDKTIRIEEDRPYPEPTLEDVFARSVSAPIDDSKSEY